jgi:hypothetical protein
MLDTLDCCPFFQRRPFLLFPVFYGLLVSLWSALRSGFCKLNLNFLSKRLT